MDERDAPQTQGQPNDTTDAAAPTAREVAEIEERLRVLGYID